MKKNMGLIDRVVRVLAALVIAGLILSGVLSGTAASILGIVTVVFILTSVFSSCPLYLLLGLSTQGTKNADSTAR